jgi:hypothetical protein
MNLHCATCDAHIEVTDVNSTGYSKQAYAAGWLQTQVPGGRVRCCPACQAKSWEGATHDGSYK